MRIPQGIQIYPVCRCRNSTGHAFTRAYNRSQWISAKPGMDVDRKQVWRGYNPAWARLHNNTPSITSINRSQYIGAGPFSSQLSSVLDPNIQMSTCSEMVYPCKESRSRLFQQESIQYDMMSWKNHTGYWIFSAKRLRRNISQWSHKQCQPVTQDLLRSVEVWSLPPDCGNTLEAGHGPKEHRWSMTKFSSSSTTGCRDLSAVELNIRHLWRPFKDLTDVSQDMWQGAAWIIVGADDTGLGGRFRLVFFAHDMRFMYQFSYGDLNTHDLGVMRFPNGQGFSHFFDMTWEDLRRILGLPGKTSANPFSPRRTLLWIVIVIKNGVGRVWEGTGGTLQMTRDLCIFLFFFTLQMTWEFAFFEYVRLLPCHLQVL